MKLGPALAVALAAPAAWAAPPSAAIGDSPLDQPPERPEKPAEKPALEYRRPAVLFHTGIGLLALPLASVCPSPSAPCQPGETSLAVTLMTLVRIRQLAFGAAADVGFGLRPEHGAPEPGRDHSRNYFSFDAIFRYYLPPLRRLDWWVGGSLGAAVLSDVWSTDVDRHPYADTWFVGPKRLTLSTEGFSFGPSIGAHWRFAERWLVGTQFRYLNWILPANRRETPLGDSASLAGRIDLVEFGVLLGFRVGL